LSSIWLDCDRLIALAHSSQVDHKNLLEAVSCVTAREAELALELVTRLVPLKRLPEQAHVVSRDALDRGRTDDDDYRGWIATAADAWLLASV
jgi:hypothetical protein